MLSEFEISEEIKKRKKVIEEIKSNLIKQELPPGYTLKLHSAWTFPDGFKLPANNPGYIVSLNYKFLGEYVPIGIMSFNYAHQIYEDKISGKLKILGKLKIDFVQGVKNYKIAERFVYPKNWAEQLMTSFLQSAIPVSFKYGRRVFFNSVDTIKTAIAIDQAEQELLREGKISYYDQISKDRLTSKSKIINALRDKFFNKEGYVNFKKERVKRIFKETVISRFRTVTPIKAQKIPKIRLPQRPKPKVK